MKKKFAVHDKMQYVYCRHCCNIKSKYDIGAIFYRCVECIEDYIIKMENEKIENVRFVKPKSFDIPLRREGILERALRKKRERETANSEEEKKLQKVLKDEWKWFPVN